MRVINRFWLYQHKLEHELRNFRQKQFDLEHEAMIIAWKKEEANYMKGFCDGLEYWLSGKWE